MHPDDNEQPTGFENWPNEWLQERLIKLAQRNRGGIEREESIAIITELERREG